jgi:putative ATP-dependent endonuclease of the OLD family
MDFSSLTVLVGENNVGKTTILMALSKILKMGESPYRVQFFDDDFYTDKSTSEKSDEIIIELTLDKLTENDKSAFLWTGIDISKNELTIRLEAKWEDENNDANVEIFFARKDDLENEKGEPLKLSHKQYVPFYYIDAYRNIRKETQSSKGDLNQIFKDFNKHYLKPLSTQCNLCIKNIDLYLNGNKKTEYSDELIVLSDVKQCISDLLNCDEETFKDVTWKIDDNRSKLNVVVYANLKNEELFNKILINIDNIIKKISITETIDDLQYKINSLHGIEKIKTDLQENLSIFVPESQIDIDFAKIDESTLLDENNVSLDDFSILKQGSGFQGSFVIALKLSRLFNHLIFSEDNVKNLIIAIEEPEAHMHPHLQRSLIKRLKYKQQKLVDLGYYIQFIISTHSPSILSQIDKSEISLIKKDGGMRKVIRFGEDFMEEIKTSMSEDKIKHFDNLFRLYPEIFLSKGVIIVEGDTEFGAIPEFAKKMTNFDLDDLGISLINAGSKNTVKPLYLILNKFTKCVAIRDNEGANNDEELIESEHERYYKTEYIDYEDEIVHSVDSLKLIKILLQIYPDDSGNIYLDLLRKHVKETRTMDAKDIISNWDSINFEPFIDAVSSTIKTELIKTLKDKCKSSLIASIICAQLDEKDIPMSYKNMLLSAKEMVLSD